MKEYKLLIPENVDKEDLKEIQNLINKTKSKLLKPNNWMICSRDHEIIKMVSEDQIENELIDLSHIDSQVYAAKYDAKFKPYYRDPLPQSYKALFENVGDKIYFLKKANDNYFVGYKVKTEEGIEIVLPKECKTNNLPSYLYRFCYIHLIEGGPRKYDRYSPWNEKEIEAVKKSKYKFITMDEYGIGLVEGKKIPNNIQAKFFKEYAENIKEDKLYYRQREKAIAKQVNKMVWD